MTDIGDISAIKTVAIHKHQTQPLTTRSWNRKKINLKNMEECSRAKYKSDTQTDIDMYVTWRFAQVKFHTLGKRDVPTM